MDDLGGFTPIFGSTPKSDHLFLLLQKRCRFSKSRPAWKNQPSKLNHFDLMKTGNVFGAVKNNTQLQYVYIHICITIYILPSYIWIIISQYKDPL